MIEKKLFHKEITGQILRAGFEVHNILDCGFLEKVYENAMLYELKHLGLKVESQEEIKVSYKGTEVGVYVADLYSRGKDYRRTQGS